MSRAAWLALVTACAGPTPTASPLEGDYGTRVSISHVEPGATVELRTHGVSMTVPLDVQGDTGSFRFPFPATGEMEVLSDGETTALAPFRPSVDLGKPKVGVYELEDVRDLLLTEQGSTLMAFDAEVVVAEADGTVWSSNFDADGLTVNVASLFPGGLFFVSGGLVRRAVLERDRAKVTSTGIGSQGWVLAAGVDERGVYFWTSIDRTNVARFREDGKPDGAIVSLPFEAPLTLADSMKVSASVAPDGTLWVGWSRNASTLFDTAAEVVAARLPADATSFEEPRVVLPIHDTVEALRLRAGRGGFDYFACGHDIANAFDQTDQRFCLSGDSSGSTQHNALRNDAGLRVTCFVDDLQVVRDGSPVLHLGACNDTSIVSTFKHAEGTSAVAFARRSIYSLRVPQ